ncbi:type II toxin-antitoxin system VapB family antitoxin [Haloferula sargassicola]
MKMTMHIDEALLARVMETYDLETKTDAVHFALNELDRKARLRAMLKEGLGLTPEELKEGVDPNYDPMRMRVAEDITPYGSERPH